MTTQYWLVKSEPDSYSWNDLMQDKKTVWSGVRNYQARNNLGAMRRGDLVLFYESVTTKAVVGIARVSKKAFTDPTADGPGWLAVELQVQKPLVQPVSLAAIKADSRLEKMDLLRLGRISVVGVAPEEYRLITRGK